MSLRLRVRALRRLGHPTGVLAVFPRRARCSRSVWSARWWFSPDVPCGSSCDALRCLGPPLR
eukprot:4200218-Alexandrium_andersonii.AAC.1